MRFNWQISAGEAFEALRPAALVASALLSTWVLASARRWRFHFLIVAALSLGTFLIPFVVVPLYLIARSSAKRQARSTAAGNPDQTSAASDTIAVQLPAATGRFVWPVAYLAVLLATIGFYLYRDYNSVDGHLARAVQARVAGQSARTIREYRAALALEDNPHTHKLLALQLVEAGQWADALNEFRLAERGGEDDPSLPFRIAQVLTATGDSDGSVVEYQRFLLSHSCTQDLPDDRCEIARKGVLQERKK